MKPQPEAKVPDAKVPDAKIAGLQRSIDASLTKIADLTNQISGIQGLAIGQFPGNTTADSGSKKVEQPAAPLPAQRASVSPQLIIVLALATALGGGVYLATRKKK